MGEDPAIGPRRRRPRARPARSDRPAGPRRARGRPRHRARPPVVVVTVHPATLDAEPGRSSARSSRAMDAVRRRTSSRCPNADPGAAEIRAALDAAADGPGRIARRGARRAPLLGAAAHRRRDARQQLERAHRGARRSACRSSTSATARPAGPRGPTSSTRRPTPRRSPTRCAARSTRRFRPGLPAPDARSLDGRAGERAAHIIAAWRPSEPTAQGADPVPRVSRRPLVILGGGEHAASSPTRPGPARISGRWRATSSPPSPSPTTGSSVEHLGDDADLVRARLTATPAMIDRRWCLASAARPGRAAPGRRGLRGRSRRGPSIVHAAAWVSPERRVEAGAVVLAGAVVNAGARVGAHAIVNTQRGRRARRRRRRAHATSRRASVDRRRHARSGRTRRSAWALPSATTSRSAIGATVGMGAVVVADVAGRRHRARRPRPRRGCRRVTDVARRAALVRARRRRSATRCARLDRGAGGIALAVDDAGRLVGVATDGDLRRALLARRDPRRARSRPSLNQRFVAVRRRAGAGRRARPDAGPPDRRRSPSSTPRAARSRCTCCTSSSSRSPRANWAVIMAGGQGTRLRPLTEDVPKPMLRVAGRPILERIVLHLVGFGIDPHLHLGQLPRRGDRGALRRRQRASACRSSTCARTEPLGTAGALGLLPARAGPRRCSS